MRAEASPISSLHKLSGWGERTSNAVSLSDGGGATATINDATWATRFFPATPWTTAGGDYNATALVTVSINNTGFYQWSGSGIIADVENWKNTPASNFGWILICNETTISTARKFGSRENAILSNRPSLSVTYTSVLPVTLTYFKATEKNNGILLNRETSQEINNHFFDVLHSIDGVVFASTGKPDGHGTSSTKHLYQFSHNMNIPGNHFYKLSKVDLIVSTNIHQ